MNRLTIFLETMMSQKPWNGKNFTYAVLKHDDVISINVSRLDRDGNWVHLDMTDKEEDLTLAKIIYSINFTFKIDL